MKNLLAGIFVSLSLISNAQSWKEISKTSSDSRTSSGWFGNSILLKQGVLLLGDSKNNNGKVTIKRKDLHGNWITTQVIQPGLTGGQSNGSDFGKKISLDGDYLAISGEKIDVNGTLDAGQVHLFKRNSNGIWEETQIITCPSPITSEDYFGAALDLHGNQLIISKTEYVASDALGSAYIYERDGTGTWVFQQRITGSGSEAWDLFANEVLIQDDYVVASSRLETQYPRTSQSGDLTGAAYIFKKDGQGNWSEVQKILPPNSKTGAEFGSSAAIQGDYLFFGAKGEDFNSTETDSIYNTGAVYVYKLDNQGDWIYEQKLVPNDRLENSNFGSSLALDGNQIAIGADNQNDGTGVCYIFNLDNSGEWIQNAKVNSSNSNKYDKFGTAIALEKKDVFIGAPYQSFNEIGTDSILGSGAIYQFSKVMLAGSAFHDLNKNGIQEKGEIPLEGRIGIIEPGGHIVRTNKNGIWIIDSVPNNSYTLTYDTSGSWTATTPIQSTFSILSKDTNITTPALGLVSTSPCPNPSITINMPFMRPCFTDQVIHVEAKNDYYATDEISAAYAIIELDSMLNFEQASLPYTDLGDHKYKFELGDILPNESVRFNIRAQVNCEANLGEVICLEANLFPVAACLIESDTTVEEEHFECISPWNNSNLVVKAKCLTDSIKFFVTNTGAAGTNDVKCFAPVRIYVDGVFYFSDSVLLKGNETKTFTFPADGNTWRLETFQHPKFAGRSAPNATIQTCGTKKRWVSNFYLGLPFDDESPIKDIYCNEVTGSYDPNDKRGFPLGLTDTNFIKPNTDIEYIIRFQNTGTDTAFTVVIKDTLDENLDLISLKSGISSHPYTLKIYGNRVIEWTFNNILLPDSNRNESESHGFVNFKVKQLKDLPDSTELNNTGYIYFDFNDPIITNTTSHVIKRLAFKKSRKEYPLQIINEINHADFSLFPNPSTSVINLTFDKKITLGQYKISDLNGKVIITGTINNSNIQAIKTSLASGSYLINIQLQNDKPLVKKFIISK